MFDYIMNHPEEYFLGCLIVAYFVANIGTTIMFTPEKRNWRNYLLPPWFWTNQILKLSCEKPTNVVGRLAA